MDRTNRPHTSRKSKRTASRSATVACQFIERSLALTELQALQVSFQRSIEQLGFRYFACCSHVDPLRPHAAVMILNYPSAWVQAYSELQLHCIDPVFERASRSGMPFSWDDPEFLWGLNARQRTMIEEARAFGIEHGYTIPVSSPRSRVPMYASCSLVPDGRLPPSHDLHFAQIMANCLFDRAAHILSSQAAHTVAPSLTVQELRALQLAGLSEQNLQIIGQFAFLLRTYAPALDARKVMQAFAELAEHKDALSLLWKSESKHAPRMKQLSEPINRSRQERTRRLTTSATQREVDRIITAVLSRVGVNLTELLSTSRREQVVLARAAIAWHVTQRELATLTEVSRLLGRAPSTLSTTIPRCQFKDPSLFRLSALSTFSAIPSAQASSNYRKRKTK